MNITVGRYDEDQEFESYIEPEDASWILYIKRDGTPYFWQHREADGAVIGEAVTR